MQPLKWWRIRKAEMAASAAIKKFVEHAGASAEQQRYFKEMIVKEKRYYGSWHEAILDPEISRRAYGQFLHCQFMGYLSEQVRITRDHVNLLRSETIKPMWQDGEDFCDAAANKAQADIYEEFLVGLKMEISALEEGGTID